MAPVQPIKGGCLLVVLCFDDVTAFPAKMALITGEKAELKMKIHEQNQGPRDSVLKFNF